MDHEFSTSALSGEQVGWDWFALHLDDGKDIMAYRMRNQDGSVDPNSNGSLLIPGNPVLGLAVEDFNISSTGTWKSPTSKASYPSGWRMLIPSQGIDLKVNSFDQEPGTQFCFYLLGRCCSDRRCNKWEKCFRFRICRADRICSYYAGAILTIRSSFRRPFTINGV